MRQKKAKLILKDQSFFEGFIFGHLGTASGEAVFNTGMVGYPEAMTDPSYYGQILVFSYPLIGNYGVADRIFESPKIQTRGIIVADYSFEYSHWEAKQSLDSWMKQHKVPGLFGVDTRVLTQLLRDKGSMLGAIVPEGQKEPEFYDPNKEDVISKVSPKTVSVYGQKNAKPRVLLLDCGAKESIVRSLVSRGCYVVRVPYGQDIFNRDFDSLVVSNGPGDPMKCQSAILAIKKAIKKRIPIFGICLGSQLLALASGAKTYKLKYGHRSQNQPCQNTETGKCYVTTQNHGFAVEEKSIPKGWKVWFRNINDGTVEGIKHSELPFWSVQFHPEANPGPTDAGFLFDEFLKLCRRK